MCCPYIVELYINKKVNIPFALVGDDIDKAANRSVSSLNVVGVCLGVAVSIKEIDFLGVEF